MYYLFNLHTASIARLSVLGEGSLLCCSPWGFSHFFPLTVGFLWKFILVRCEGQRTEGVVLSYWYSVTFVTLGYISKHWLIDWSLQPKPMRLRWDTLDIFRLLSSLNSTPGNTLKSFISKLLLFDLRLSRSLHPVTRPPFQWHRFNNSYNLVLVYM